jgi:hypothetical protein
MRLPAVVGVDWLFVSTRFDPDLLTPLDKLLLLAIYGWIATKLGWLGCNNRFGLELVSGPPYAK